MSNNRSTTPSVRGTTRLRGEKIRPSATSCDRCGKGLVRTPSRLRPDGLTLCGSCVHDSEYIRMAAG